MNYKFLTLLLVILVIISGCSNFSGSGNQGPETKNHGEGLKVDFRIDDEYLPNLRYTLRLENDGEETIEINRRDISLTSTKRMVSGDLPFSQGDRDKLINQIFNNNNLVLGPHQIREFTGTIKINEEYYQDPTNDELDIIFKVSFPYTTQFSSNVELNPNNFAFKVERVDLSGPINVNSIEGVYDGEELLNIVYELRNRGDSTVATTIDNPRFSLGTNVLSCSNYVDEQGNKIPTQSSQITQEKNSLYIVCRADVSQYDSQTNTITSGEYSYIYSISKSQSISFPESRSSSPFS